MAQSLTDIMTNAIGGSAVTATSGWGTLGADPGTSGTTLTLTTGHGARFPAISSTEQLRLRIDNEIVIVTAHTANSDTMTMVRGQENTGPGVAHSVGAEVKAVITEEAVRRQQPVRQPRDHKLLAMSQDPTYLTSNHNMPAGQVLLTQIPIRETVTVANVGVLLSTVGVNGAATLANSFFALFTSGGTRIAVSADQSTTLTTGVARLVTVALVVDGGQSLTLTGGADSFVFGASLIGTQSSTAALLMRGASQSFAANAGLVATDVFFAGSSGSAQTAMPSSITPTALTSNTPIWYGLS